MSERDVSKFYCGVRRFFETATEYSFKNLPYNDDVLRNAGFVMVENRMNVNQLQVEFFVSRCCNTYTT